MGAIHKLLKLSYYPQVILVLLMGEFIDTPVVILESYLGSQRPRSKYGGRLSTNDLGKLQPVHATNIY